MSFRSNVDDHEAEGGSFREVISPVASGIPMQGECRIKEPAEKHDAEDSSVVLEVVARKGQCTYLQIASRSL